MNLEEVDLLGFSIGSFVAQEIALTRPSVAHRIVLASWHRRARPACTGGHPTSSARSARHTRLLRSTSVFGAPTFAPTDSSKKAGQEAVGRMYARQEDRDTPTDWACRVAQYDEVCGSGTLGGTTTSTSSWAYSEDAGYS
jgi:pimeloyl-ACP methyl ester carboxylesterase